MPNKLRLRIINLPRRVYNLLRAFARPRLQETATERADGTFDVPIEESTLNGLRARSLPGETVADTIERLLILASTDNKLQ